MFEKLGEVIRKVLGQEPPPSAAARVKARSVAARPAAPLTAAARAAAAVEIPRHCTDPSAFEHVPGANVWQFCVPDATHACAAALRLADKRTDPASAVKVPLPECDRSDCHCNYRLLRDARKGPRRSGAERREEVRFEVKKVDRRKNDGRRKEDGWSGAKP